MNNFRSTRECTGQFPKDNFTCFEWLNTAWMSGGMPAWTPVQFKAKLDVFRVAEKWRILNLTLNSKRPIMKYETEHGTICTLAVGSLMNRTETKSNGTALWETWCVCAWALLLYMHLYSFFPLSFDSEQPCFYHSWVFIPHLWQWQWTLFVGFSTHTSASLGWPRDMEASITAWERLKLSFQRNSSHGLPTSLPPTFYVHASESSDHPPTLP